MARRRHPPGLPGSLGPGASAGWSGDGGTASSPVSPFARAASLGRMVEAVGDSSRDGAGRSSGSAVDGDRIVERRRRGARAAARGADAARGCGGRRRRARRRRACERARRRSSAPTPQPGRVAVAMSGGVDSAVALLRAGRERDRRHAAPLARPARARRRARLLLARGGDRRPRDVPRARAPARHARPARGVPARRRRAVRPRLRGAARRRTPASAATAASASPSCSPSRARRRRRARDRPLRADRRARRPPAARARGRPAKDQSYMLAPSRPALPRPPLVPARRADEGRRRAPRPSAPGSRRPVAPRARRRASSPAATTATSSSATGSRGEAGPIVDEDGRELGRHAGFWRFTPGQRRGLGVSADEPLYALRSDAAHEHRRRRATRGARDRARSHVRGRLHLPVDRAEAKLRYRSPAVAAAVTPTEHGFRLHLERRPTASRPARRPFSTTMTSSSVPARS